MFELRTRALPAAMVVSGALMGPQAGAQDLADASIGYSIPASGLEIIDTFADMLERTTD